MEVTEFLELLGEEGDVVLIEGQSLQTVQLTQLRGDCVQAVAIEIEFLKVGELVRKEMRRGERESGGKERESGGEERESREKGREGGENRRENGGEEGKETTEDGQE